MGRKRTAKEKKGDSAHKSVDHQYCTVRPSVMEKTQSFKRHVEGLGEGGRTEERVRRITGQGGGWKKGFYWYRHPDEHKVSSWSKGGVGGPGEGN